MGGIDVSEIFLVTFHFNQELAFLHNVLLSVPSDACGTNKKALPFVTTCEDVFIKQLTYKKEKKKKKKEVKLSRYLTSKRNFRIIELTN